MPDSGYFALFVVGLLGAPHCVGMCGGIVAALASQPGGGGGGWPVHLAYNAGRIASYGVAGALAGLLGGLGSGFGSLAAVQWLLYLLANLMLIAMGIYLAGMTGVLAQVERAGQGLWRRIQPLTARFLPVRGIGQAFPLGLLWGWLPCGLVYSALATALTLGSPGRGAAAMAIFGLGTLPNLLLAGLLLARFRRFTQQTVIRLVAGVLVGGYGLLGLSRAMGFAHILWR